MLPFQTPASQTSDEQLALQYFQDREFEKAAEIYDRLYAAKPTSTYYFYYFYCLVENQDYDKAEKLIRTARKNDPDGLKYIVDQGYVYYRQGNEEKAHKTYDEALKKMQPVVQQVYELANAFLMRGEDGYAVKTYLKGREMFNTPTNFGFELASEYERTGDYTKMLDEYIGLLEINQTYLQTIEDRLQMFLANDPNNSKNEILRKYLLEKAQKDPERTYYSELLWWYSIQQKDFELALLQAKSLDRRLKEDGGRVFQLSKLCVSNENWDAALEGYQYLVSKGKDFPYYEDARRELLNTRYLKLVSGPSPSVKSLEELEKEFRKEMEFSGKAPGLVRNLAHIDAFYLNRTDEAVALLQGLVDKPDISLLDKAGIKIELADILLFTGQVWDASLLYQQVYQDFKNDEIGQQAKFRNARLSFYIGEFKWAKDQADILKAATTKLIANDAMALSLLISENTGDDSTFAGLRLYARGDLLDYRNQDDLAIRTLDSVFILFTDHPIFDDVLLKKAEIRMKQGLYAEADTLLGTLLANYRESILADKALMMRARLNEIQLNDRDRAMKYYEAVILDYPGSIYVVDARKKYRSLRGDQEAPQ